MIVLWNAGAFCLRLLLFLCACRALDAFEPAVQFDNGTVVSANTSFFQIDSISTATGAQLVVYHFCVA